MDRVYHDLNGLRPIHTVVPWIRAGAYIMDAAVHESVFDYIGPPLIEAVFPYSPSHIEETLGILDKVQEALKQHE